jgi:heat shock protein HslJ
VLNILTDPLPVEAVMVGDRIGVKTLTIDGTQVTLDVVAQGQGDTDCCASWNTRVVYELKDDQLLETNRTEHNRISLGDLNNTQWSLVTRAVDQKLIPSRITLQIEDNQISGFSGCNDYSASISPGEYGLNSVHLSEIATSEEVCPQPATLQEADYLNQLGSVVSWNYDYGYLSLLYATENDRLENLLFAPAGEQ